MGRRVNIPSHGQSTKDFLPDVIRGWLVLQRSGLSESSKKTVLGSTENMLGRSRIVEALKQQWPGHELLAYDGDHKRDRGRKVRAYVQAEADEWKPETYQKESATDSAWNVSEPRDAWEQASVDEAGTWEDEDDPFEGSFADEDEEEAFHLAETQLNEALASERNARRTVAQARAIMHDIKSSRGGYYPQGASKKGSEAGKGKGKGQGKDRDSRRQAYGQSSNLSASQTGTRLHKPMPSSVRPCLKCGSRDHESSKCAKNQEHRSYMAHALNFTAWCLGSDEMQNKTAEAFGCENRERGKVLLDCGATDTVGSVEAIIDKSQEAFEADSDLVSVDTKDWPVYKFGDDMRKQAMSKIRVKVQPGGHAAHLYVHAQETEGVPLLLSAKSLSTWRATINFETGQAVFRNLEPETVVQLERSPTGHLWMDLFEQMPVVSDNPWPLLGESQSEKKVGRMSENSKAQVRIDRTDSHGTLPFRPTHETDNSDKTTRRRSKVQFEKSVSLEPQFDLKTSINATSKDGFRENCSYVARRSDGTIRTAGMGTSCERDVYSSRKEKHPARIRGKDDEVRDERQFQCMRRSESKEQDRAERRVQDAQHSVVGTRDDTTAEEVRDTCGTVSWNVSEGFELSSKKAAQSNSKAGARRRNDRLRETSGTSASDGSTTKDCSEVQCNLKTMSVLQRAVLRKSGKQLSMDEYEQLTTSEVERTDLAEIGNTGQNALLST